MNLTRARIIQIISMFVVQMLTLFILPNFLSGFTYDSFRSLFVLTIVLAITQSLFWWVFIYLFSWLPVWLFPILTFIINGALFFRIGDLVPGIYIADRATGLWISIWLTVVNAIMAGILSVDEDSRFDRNVVGKMVKRRGQITTGLPTQPLAVAIPHADPDHVNRSAVCIGVLNAPIRFAQMGTDGSTFLDVHLIFILAIKEREKQVEMIQQLMSVIQNASLLKGLSKATDPADAFALIQKTLTE